VPAPAPHGNEGGPREPQDLPRHSMEVPAIRHTLERVLTGVIEHEAVIPCLPGVAGLHAADAQARKRSANDPFRQERTCDRGHVVSLAPSMQS
jgi:hypothetical protein